MPQEKSAKTVPLVLKSSHIVYKCDSAVFLFPAGVKQGLGKALPNKIPMGRNERTANYGTSVESCSKKLPLSSTADFAAIRRGAAWLVSVNIAITAACPAHLCSPLRTETENAKRSFGFFITTTAGKPISGKLPRHSLPQGNGAFCQKWEQKTPRIFKNLWRCCLEQYSILVSRSLFWVKEKDNRFWLSCENVYYVVLCKIDKIKLEDHSSTKYLYAAASSSPHSLSKLPFSS